MSKDIDLQLFEAAQILQLKQRAITKGFILIASSWEQVGSLVQPIGPKSLSRVFASWPGPVTWVFPSQPHVPHWIHGKHSSIAIRITDHPIAAKLCTLFAGPIISTSANIEGFPPIRDRRTLELTFNNKIDFIVPGALGSNINPTQIRDAISGEILRP